MQKEKIVVPLQSNIAGWSSWQLVGLITRRSQVRVLFPLLRRSNDLLFLCYMFTVYVLYSKEYNKIYIGFTANLEQRLTSHNSLGTKGYTLKFRPWQIAYSETFDTKSPAMKREKELKSAKGREFIWKLIKENY